MLLHDTRINIENKYRCKAPDQAGLQVSINLNNLL